MNPVLFEPIYKERVWGGRTLETALNRKLPGGKIIGESWELVDRPEDNSSLRKFPGEVRTLRDLIRSSPEEVMGPSWDPERRFPILVKWLDCQQRLSLQVHPPAPIAPKLGGEPKTENWFVADCRPGSALLVGLKEGVSQEEFEKALREERLEACIHRIPTMAGQSLLVESGRIHAIDGGNLILEIQQNSDTTYRVYDWGRAGLDGKPRELHIEESLQCIDFDDFEPNALAPFDEPGEVVLADCPEFRIRRSNQDIGGTLLLENGRPALLHMVRGNVRDSESDVEITSGDTALIPASYTGRLAAVAESTILLTDRFV